MHLTLYLCAKRPSLYVHKFFFVFGLMYCDQSAETIQGRKIFKVGIYSRKYSIKKIFVLSSLMVFNKYIPISNRPFPSNDLSYRKVGEEGGMWTLERKSLFANKIHASSHEERRLHELFFERCCHLLLWWWKKHFYHKIISLLFFKISSALSLFLNPTAATISDKAWRYLLL